MWGRRIGGEIKMTVGYIGVVWDGDKSEFIQ